MARIVKSLEEQLAEVRAKKAQVAARLDRLEARKKLRDARMRAWGEKLLVGVVLNAATSQAEFKAVLERVVAEAELKPKEREVVGWLLASLEPTRPTANGVPAQVAAAPSPAPAIA